ncbi:dihydroxyacetone kinase subunit DhaL [Paramicrobacterium sp. CJ85]|uniref:dihydroxyacetone kinase subunit DhaL n=1 Tax=Paramicrobacterium sp. CJ85 TaxID=3445355 RepID=UPI003F60F5CB
MNGTETLAWFARFSESFASQQSALTDMDRLAGDGDFGTNIASALARAEEALPQPDDATPSSVFRAVSTGFLATGGTSGPLFGMFFREVANALREASDVDALSRGVASGLARIQQLGGAKVGDRTMVDALAPASEALTAQTEGERDAAQALRSAAEAARAGAESTEALLGSRGRASYVGELARGVLDPGAVTIALFFEAGADALVASPLTAAIEADVAPTAERSAATTA